MAGANTAPGSGAAPVRNAASRGSALQTNGFASAAVPLAAGALNAKPERESGRQATLIERQQR